MDANVFTVPCNIQLDIMEPSEYLSLIYPMRYHAVPVITVMIKTQNIPTVEKNIIPCINPNNSPCSVFPVLKQICLSQKILMLPFYPILQML